MAQQRKRLPQDVAVHIDVQRDALAAIASGEDRTKDVTDATDAAVRAAWAHADEQASTSKVVTASFDKIISTRLKETRAESGWTQAQLADAMSPYASWGRFTIAEIESGRRSVSLEELVLLASLYGEPVLSFMIPTDRTRLELEHTNVAPGVLAELFVGRGGAIGVGGRSWAAAARVATAPDARPAPDLWANRSEHDRRTPASSSTQTKRTDSKKRKT